MSVSCLLLLYPLYTSLIIEPPRTRHTHPRPGPLPVRWEKRRGDRRKRDASPRRLTIDGPRRWWWWWWWYDDLRNYREEHCFASVIAASPTPSRCRRISFADALPVGRLGHRSHSRPGDDDFSVSRFKSPVSIPPKASHPVISALGSFARGGGKREESPCWWYNVYLYDTRNNLPRNSYYCVLDDFRLFIFYLLCKIYNTDSILETSARLVPVCFFTLSVRLPSDEA